MAAGIAYNADMSATSMKELAAEAVGAAGRQGRYFEDVWSWSREQADALRRRDFSEIDWDNLIEEIEDVGNRHADEWISYCANVISHLLKIEYSGAEENVNHWRGEIESWRWRMNRRILKNLGMNGNLSEMLAEAWEDGRRTAVRKLAEEARPESWAAEKRTLRELELRLPRERPYALVEIVGYDPFDKKGRPDPDVWPLPVAQRLNEALGADYPARRWGAELESERLR